MMRYCLPVLALAALSACSAHPPQQAAAPRSGEVQAGLARIRQVTQRFASIDSAVASGYPRTVAQCIDHYSHNSAMGYHHVNRALVDRQVDLDRPEILLYERGADSSYTLTAVEYIVPFRVWPQDSVPPTLMGMPMNREQTLGIWYMHVWIHKENPFGTFADWHPAIRCPATPATRPAP